MESLERIAADTLRIERLLEAPVETVWRWLVEPALRRQWFAGGGSAAVPGPLDLVFDHDELSTDPSRYPGRYARFKGAVSHERVLAAEPPRRLAFSWDEGKEGTVTIELFPDGARTRLVLTHGGISDAARLVGFAGGWEAHLSVLQGRLTGAPVRDFWALHRRVEAAVAQKFAAR